MKRVIFTILISVLVLLLLSLIEVNVYKIFSNKNKNESESILERTKAIINNESVQNGANVGISGLDNDNLQEENSNQDMQSHDNASESINTNVQSSKDNIICEDDIIGILKIEKLNVEGPIRDGTSQEIMKTAIGHFTESDYWSGNVSFASHNGGTNAHYFEKINEVQVNDEIQYITKLGTKIYKVQSITKINDKDWTMVKKQDEIEENTITLITCINGQPHCRLCVRGIEK